MGRLLENQMKYFTRAVEHPRMEGELLPFGTIYTETAYPLLDGFVNFFAPLKAYCLCTHCGWKGKLNGGIGFTLKISTRIPPCRILGTWVPDVADALIPWRAYKFTIKENLFDTITLRHALHHMKLHYFQDEVVIVSENVSTPGEYAFFRYDSGGPHCCLGRFTTEDSKEDILKEFDRFVALEDGGDAKEIPLHAFCGWLSF